MLPGVGIMAPFSTVLEICDNINWAIKNGEALDPAVDALGLTAEELR